MKKTSKKRCISIVLIFCLLLLSVNASSDTSAHCPLCSRPCSVTYTTTRTDNGYASHTLTTRCNYECWFCHQLGHYPSSVVAEFTHPYTRSFMGTYDSYGCRSCPAAIWAPHTHMKIQPTIKRIDNWVVYVEYRCTECGEVLN